MLSGSERSSGGFAAGNVPEDRVNPWNWTERELNTMEPTTQRPVVCRLDPNPAVTWRAPRLPATVKGREVVHAAAFAALTVNVKALLCPLDVVTLTSRAPSGAVGRISKL